MVVPKSRQCRKYTPCNEFTLRDEDTIANTIIKIMEDGPQPMKERKPANRVPDSAERFNDTHQSDYESRGLQTVDWVKTAQKHNQAYPVLYDELNKRRSIAKVH